MTMEGDPVEQTEGFYARVYALVGQIPPGRVVSYGQIAWALGAPAYGEAGRLGHAALPGMRCRGSGSCAPTAASRAAATRRCGERCWRGRASPSPPTGAWIWRAARGRFRHRRCTMAEHRDEADFRVWYEEVYCKEEG